MVSRIDFLPGSLETGYTKYFSIKEDSVTVQINGNMAGGITGSNFVLNDVNSAGSIRVSTIAIENNGASTALDVSVGVDIGPSGVVAEVIQLGTLAGGMDLRLGGV